MKRARHPHPPRKGFTLLELLVTMAVLSLFVMLLFSVTDNSFKLWRSTHSSIAMFDEARAAFDAITRRLSQATVNTYLDYYDSTWARRPNAATNAAGAAAFIPAKYGRASDLHFLSGNANTILGGTSHPGHGVFFFAPLGFTDSNATYADLPNLLNACGYYIEWGSDKNFRPGFLSTLPEKNRFRLIENIQPSQNFVDYPTFTNTDPSDDKDWITTGLKTDGKPHVLGDNIIALIIRPEVPEQDATSLGLTGKEGITGNYTYDSRSVAGQSRSNARDAAQFAQLPPMLRVVMVAVDEKNAARLTKGTTPPAALTLDSTWFTDPSEAVFQKNLDDFAKQLAAAGVQFRIFNQVIALRGAKFSAKKEN
jgi:uncharacterized protein (TIGR02599 family)